MTVAAMNSHRKLITYGKTSRKSTCDKGSVAADEFSRHSNEGSWGDAQRIRGGADQILPNNFLHTKPDSMIHRSNKPELPCQRSAALKHSRIGKPQHKHYLSMRHASALSKKDTMIASPDHGPPLDEPSSSQDCEIWNSSAGGLCRKVEELMPDAVTEKATFVYDDESLQRHVAAEISNDQSRFKEFQRNLNPKGAKSNSAPRTISGYAGHHQDSRSQSSGKRHPDLSSRTPRVIQRASADRSTFKSNVITIAKSVDSTRSQREGLPSASSPAHHICNFDGRSQRSTPQRHVPESGSGSDQPASALNRKSKRPSEGRAINSNSLTTPPKEATANESTTPRQRELWNTLLKDDTGLSTSTSPSFAGIAMDHQEKHPSQKSNSRGERSVLMKPVFKIPHKRRRLVDNLLGDDNDPYYTDDFSQAEVDASYNPRSTSSGAGGILPDLDPASFNAPKKILQDRAGVLPSHTQPALLHQGGWPKVTYARQRSYLTDDDISQTGLFDMPIVDDLVSGARKRLQGASEWTSRFLHQESVVEDQNDVTESQGNTMRNIHELREAGGNARVFSEMEAILDDIDEANAMSPPLKRSRLLYLAIKLQEPSFCRLFIDQGLYQRLFDHPNSTNDILIETLYAAILLCLLPISTSISKISCFNNSSAQDFLVELLDKDEDLTLSLRNRNFNLSKAAQAEFKNLWDSLLLNSTVWRAGRPTILTPCMISLQCLEYLVRHAREMGSVHTDLPQASIRSIVRILQPDPSGSLLLPSPRPTVEMHLSVSILESCTINNGFSYDDSPWTGHTLDTIVGLLPLLDSWLQEDIGTLRTLTLRLYLNLTNNSPTLCKAFSRPDVIGSMLNIIVSHFRRLSENDMLHKREVLLDNLILSLGSMINLAEWCDTVRPLLLSLRSGDTCFLDTLVQLFTSKQKKSAEVRAFTPSYLIS